MWTIVDYNDWLLWLICLFDILKSALAWYCPDHREVSEMLLCPSLSGLLEPPGRAAGGPTTFSTNPKDKLLLNCETAYSSIGLPNNDIECSNSL